MTVAAKPLEAATTVLVTTEMIQNRKQSKGVKDMKKIKTYENNIRNRKESYDIEK